MASTSLPVGCASTRRCLRRAIGNERRLRLFRNARRSSATYQLARSPLPRISSRRKRARRSLSPFGDSQIGLPVAVEVADGNGVRTTCSTGRFPTIRSIFGEAAATGHAFLASTVVVLD